MSLRTFNGEDIILRRFDGETLYDIIEDDVIVTHNNQPAGTAGNMSDGTAALPGLPFLDDLDTGIFRPSSNNFGISTNGIQRINIGTSSFISLLPTRLNYQSGSPQLEFQRSDGLYNVDLYVDPSNHFYISQNSGSANLYLQQAANGHCDVQPNSSSITSVDFCVNVGDGASSYLNLFNIDENRILSINPIQMPNGSASLPSHTFSNFTGNGMYSTSSTLLGFSANGALQLSLDSSTDSVVLSANNLLGQGTLEISNQGGENIIFNDATQTVSFEANDTAIMDYNTTFVNLYQDLNVEVDLNPQIALKGVFSGTNHYGYITMKSSGTSDTALQFFNDTDESVSATTDIFTFLNPATTKVASITNAGAILASSNSIANPAFSSTIDTDTGMTIGSGLVSLIANTTQSVQITSTSANFLNSTAILYIVPAAGSPPASSKGGLVYSDNEAAVCYYNGTSWLRVDDNTAATF